MSTDKKPNLIYGTAWKKEKTAIYVEDAIKLGFRAIDTACQPRHYREDLVGEGIKKSGVERDELFIQTKFTPQGGQDPSSIPYDPNFPIDMQIRASLEVSMENLQTDFLDSLILHSPLHTFGETLKAWRTFEEFVKEGRVGVIGISNCYNPDFFKKLYEQASIKPSFLQNRFYKDSDYDIYLRAFCNENSITYQSFWTLTANPDILGSSLFVDLQKKYEKTAEQILFRYLTLSGVVPLIGSTSKTHLKQDLDIFSFRLDKSDVEQIDKLL